MSPELPALPDAVMSAEADQSSPVSRDWRLWADATCAGLSVLIPLPLVDLFFEGIFRRRIPGAVARFRQQELPVDVRQRLGQGDWDLVGGCIALPIKLVKYVLRKFWRKLLYVFTVADAVDALNTYWHRAFLIDHLVRSGHAASSIDVELTAEVFAQTLDGADMSGVKSLARQVVKAASHVPGLLRRARRGGAEDATRDLKSILDSHWQVLEASLLELAARYDRLYAENQASGLRPQASDSGRRT